MSATDDPARIREEAHALKGAAGTLGLAQLSGLARTLEQGAASMPAADYADLLTSLSDCFENTRREAEQALADLAAAA